MKRVAYLFFILLGILIIISVSCSEKKKSPTGPDYLEFEGITFVSIPGGTYQMGDEVGDLDDDCRPVHTVTLDGFDMSITEISNAQYCSYLNEALASGDITGDSLRVEGAIGDYSGEEYFSLYANGDQILYDGETFMVDSGMESRPVISVTWYGAKSFALYYELDFADRG